MANFGDVVNTIPYIIDRGNDIEKDSVEGDLGWCRGRWDGIIFDGLLEEMKR